MVFTDKIVVSRKEPINHSTAGKLDETVYAMVINVNESSSSWNYTSY